jgi:hypothetical protein
VDGALLLKQPTEHQCEGRASGRLMYAMELKFVFPVFVNCDLAFGSFNAPLLIE